MEYVLVNIVYFLELLMILVYAETLWKQKICFSGFGLILFIINAIVINAVNLEMIPGFCTWLIHIILLTYLCIRNKSTSLVVNITKYCIVVILTWATELVSGLFVYLIAKTIDNDNIKMVITNTLGLIISIFVSAIVRKCTNRILMEVDYKSLLYTALICIIPIYIMIVSYVNNHKVNAWYSISITVIGIMLIIYLVKLQKSEYKIKQKNLEIEINKTYGKVYEDIINNIRRKQHNYDNQITALFSLNKTAKSFEELTELQSNYYAAITSDNEYDYILSACNEPVLAGFIYSKCISCKEQGVRVDCDIHVERWTVEILMHELVEILGILIDNAKEATLDGDFEDKNVSISINEFSYMYSIIVSNRIAEDVVIELDKLFAMDYSTKGEHRGLGLPRVKQICNKYRFEIQVSIDNNPERNIVFSMNIPK